MEVTRLASVAEVVAAAADRLVRCGAGNPELVLGLPTGRTMVPLYAELARRTERGELDLRRCRAFNLDELLLPRTHPASFRRYMERHVLRRNLLDRDRWDIPDSQSDPDLEVARYEKALAAAGGLDLAILGLGADGHVAYNLPGPAVRPVHVVRLPEPVAAKLEIDPDRRPVEAITLGLGAFEEAGQLLLIATGEEKADAVRALVEGAPDPNWPASLLKGHPQFEILLDPGAASGLR